jgi:two-component system, cell cycle response regulator
MNDPPRLRLLDWVMPEKDGVEVCREIRHRRGKAYTYLILLSSKESKMEIVEGLEAGADHYLTKPYDEEELKARLRAGEHILELEDHLVEARETMWLQATHDALTSLWNRGSSKNCWPERFIARVARKLAPSLFLCDVDHSHGGCEEPFSTRA